jgi:glycosyltransferase involved in cell wall biosynthesis
MTCLEEKKPGASLRFGQADIDLALGIRKPGMEWPDALILEMRAAFLLSGENIFKALEVECPALGLPLEARAQGISDRQAFDRLNAVGACFLDGPIYSNSAFACNGMVKPGLLEQSFETLKACQPSLVFKEGEARQPVLEKIAPAISIAVPREEEYGQIDRLEEEILHAPATAANSFPVVVLALGPAGRILAKQLLKRGFPGFLLDLDNLQEIPVETGAGRTRRELGPHDPHVEKPAASSDSSDKLTLRWEGPYLGHYSYSIINRELCSRLGRNERIELSLRPDDTPFTTDPFNPTDPAGFRSLVDRVNRPLSRPAQIHVSNHARRPYLPPAEGRWVVILPWDYGSLPVRWVDWIRTRIDEVWVPSRFVRSAFLETGLPPERVAVVPNGVDVRLYRPDARKVKLNTRKAFKFLFVGGPFWRKGFDILLGAYGRAFTARDDVSLVIKGAPEFWTGAGTQRLAEFRSRPGAPEVVAIVRSLEPVRMAGLYASCDCLVHPYRAEGFAMCVAEGMASGLPVIVTGVGGTTDFCDAGTAYLLPAELRRMDKKQIDNEPTLDFPTYAEPDVNALVERMRYVYEHPGEAGIIARSGMQKIRAEFTWEHAAGVAVQRLAALEGKPIQRFTGG